ncbi:hypothetical protein M8C21_000627, partial [Ambrosia artemisiifolia]
MAPLVDGILGATITASIWFRALMSVVSIAITQMVENGMFFQQECRYQSHLLVWMKIDEYIVTFNFRTDRMTMLDQALEYEKFDKFDGVRILKIRYAGERICILLVVASRETWVAFPGNPSNFGDNEANKEDVGGSAWETKTNKTAHHGVHLPVKIKPKAREQAQVVSSRIITVDEDESMLQSFRLKMQQEVGGLQCVF